MSKPFLRYTHSTFHIQKLNRWAKNKEYRPYSWVIFGINKEWVGNAIKYYTISFFGIGIVIEERRYFKWGA